MKVRNPITNRRGQKLAPIACMALAMALSGCVATKSDVRMLRSDIAVLQSRQDSLYRQSLMQMSAQADSVRMLTDLLRTTRGQLANQIRSMQEMVVTLQELSAQNAASVRDVRDRIQSAATPPAPAPVSQRNAADADQLYRLGMTKLQDRSAASARAAFQEFLSQFPNHEHAGDAQFGLAETYVLDEALEDAVNAFERVAEAYPTSPRAPEALYRAGEVSEQRKKPADARRYYNLVRQRYADSPTARLAKQKLDKLK